MTGEQLRALRRRSRLGVVAFGRALGYGGNDNTISVRVRRLEQLSRLAEPDELRAAGLMLELDARDQFKARRRLRIASVRQLPPPRPLFEED